MVPKIAFDAPAEEGSKHTTENDGKKRRPTGFVGLSDLNKKKMKEKRKEKKPTVMVKNVVRWWEKPSVQYAFSQPHVRAHVEKLMETNVISITDRIFMTRLQARVLEEYRTDMDNRIAKRSEEELERVKKLVLTGIIPISNAPPTMANHPVVLIDQYCNTLIEERRAKMKKPAAKIPHFLYYDDTSDPPSGLSIEKGHIFRSSAEQLCLCPFVFLETTYEEDIEKGFMLEQEEYDRLKYESDEIKELLQCETVEDIYRLADGIIGNLVTG